MCGGLACTVLSAYLVSSQRFQRTGLRSLRLSDVKPVPKVTELSGAQPAFKPGSYSKTRVTIFLMEITFLLSFLFFVLF